jgi:threonine synthase
MQELGVEDLRCLRCGRREPYTGTNYLCAVCGHGSGPSDAGVLDVRYDYEHVKRELFGGRAPRAAGSGVFRYLPLLPVADVPRLLPAGGTPLFESDALAAQFGVAALYLKDETRNPTRALKDRATAVGVARAVAQGYTDIGCASAGNAAISMAAFAAVAGLRAHAFVPGAASDVRLTWLERLGADVRRSTGDYDAAYDEAESMRSESWYSRNAAFNPFLVEGKKTAGLEIAEQLEWRVPDLVVCPVGDGCTLAAIGKGFRELAQMGVTDRLPRLVGVQAAATQPLVEPFESNGSGLPGTPREARTFAASIDVKQPRNKRRLLEEIETSDGVILAVGDEAIGEAQRDLAQRAGVVAEFTSAASLAGLRRLAEHEPIGGKTVALVITGGRPDDT